MEPSTPILVGCGEVSDQTTPCEAARSPFDLIAAAGRVALADAGGAGLAAAIDTVAMVRLFADSSYRFATNLGTSTNPPKSIAQRLHIAARRHIYTHSGGNMPQFLVNHFAEAISRGEMRAVLLAGGEALRTQRGLERVGASASWNEEPGGEPEMIGDARRAWSDEEARHNLRAAIAMYPLVENAIRGKLGRTIEEHLLEMGRLFARFSQVAAANPLATRREVYSAERLATVDADNRWIGFPYPKLMNSNAFIDQAAALVMTSVGEAQRLGIPQTKWVFLHGCADGHDHWHVSERVELAGSAAIRMGARRALAMAGRRLDEIDSFDLYSCFPAAVEIGCQEIGLTEDDPRGLTVTGGLPFFGGPGNNYVTHSIAEMMRRVRAKPGAFGLVTANGNYVTKHSFGVYSTRPVEGRWQREDPSVLQRELDSLPKAALVEQAAGPATVETYTIMHGKNGPERCVLFGRLDVGGARFIANTPIDAQVLADFQSRDQLGRRGSVRPSEAGNLFVPQ